MRAQSQSSTINTLLQHVVWYKETERCFLCIHKRMVQFQKLLQMYFSPYTSTTYTVSSGNCPSFSYATSSSFLMLIEGPQDQFARWSHSRIKLSVCYVLRCPDLTTVQRGFCVHFKKDMNLMRCVFFKPWTKPTLHCRHRSGHLKM
jgi:hypothetical protein